jgi:hypothetical protein
MVALLSKYTRISARSPSGVRRSPRFVFFFFDGVIVAPSGTTSHSSNVSCEASIARAKLEIIFSAYMNAAFASSGTRNSLLPRICLSCHAAARVRDDSSSYVQHNTHLMIWGCDGAMRPCISWLAAGFCYALYIVKLQCSPSSCCVIVHSSNIAVKLLESCFGVECAVFLATRRLLSLESDAAHSCNRPRAPAHK